ncbi:beta-glucanase [Siphonobacter sp. SORGH_AS_0500]|uniref:glycoside hydrolase family 43 protein n=1 Tax=Siphonobacter sp. SORGH_AS_0500 TaxID=1864824 RepID=UPI000CC452FA|nr:glycoside hydrolase family 43 protein [Siphonobacter sp. SORGH_AS_0500]PKK37183.1 beta-glucanase [Siphonobacter sp. SORGH_AS_0500]
MVHNRLLALTMMLGLTLLGRAQAQTKQLVIKPGERWLDNRGEVINAHGGGLLFSKGTYYWFGEKRGKTASEGVNVYSSKDLSHWKNEGLALSQSTDPSSDITVGCLMERPKVIYNPKTKQYVMWFHLELAGKGYDAARAGVAVSEKPTGPYRFLSSFRPNGNMSRDMTLFVDEDGSAYHMYSSQDNYDLRVVKLTDDYLGATTQDSLLFSAHREAPAIFKRNNRYYLITSGCTGWAPNAASVHEASSIYGPWKLVGDPMQGPSAKTTFGGQSTYVQPIHGKPDAFLFMADRWNPQDLKDSRYLWLPISFENDQPVIRWTDQWDLNVNSKGY